MPYTSVSDCAEDNEGVSETPAVARSAFLQARQTAEKCLISSSVYTLEPVSEGVEIVKGDLEDIESIEEAFRIAYGVFGLTNCACLNFPFWYIMRYRCPSAKIPQQAMEIRS